MKKTICCRCLTQTKTGYGNFSRCVTIASELKKNGINTIFLIDNNSNIIDQIKKRKFNYFVIPKKFKKNNEFSFILKIMKSEKISTIMIDMRQYGEFLSKQLTNHQKVILIDDIWSQKIYSDLFFNMTNIKTLKNYKIINPNSKIFLGLKYWPINYNLIKYRKKISDIKYKKILNLVITMGGSDPNNLSYNVLKMIKDVGGINIFIIIGPMNKNYLKLKTLTQKRKNIHLIKSSNLFYKELSKADIAITNGGNTLFELIGLGVPTISIPAFKHEINFAQKFSKHNCVINLGFNQKNRKIICNTLNKMINDIDLRKGLHRSSSKEIDGNGLKRVITNILKAIQ